MRVGIDTASTTPKAKPISDGASRGRSQLPGQAPGWLPAGSPLVGLPLNLKVWTKDALELARLLLFDRGFKRGTATMCVRAAFKTAVEKDQRVNERISVA